MSAGARLKLPTMYALLASLFTLDLEKQTYAFMQQRNQLQGCQEGKINLGTYFTPTGQVTKGSLNKSTAATCHNKPIDDGQCSVTSRCLGC